MDYDSLKTEEKIYKIAESNNGYVTTKEVVQNDISRMYLTKLVNENKIVRCSRGLYALPDVFLDEYYKYQTIANNSVYCMETALYLHGYSDRVPHSYNMSVPRNYSGLLSKEKGVKLQYLDREILDLGVTEIVSPMGQKIRVYDLDRTICDIVKGKSKMDPEIFSKALKEYVSSKDKDLNNLISYARKLKVEKEIRNYLEILL